MAIAFRAADGAAPSASTTATITMPGTVAAGDLIIVTATINSGSSNVFTSGPSGYNALTVSTDASQLTGVWWKIATGSDANPTVTCANSGKWVATLSAYSGCDPTTPILTSQSLDSPGTANSWTMPNLTASVAGCWRVDCLGQRSSTPATSWTAPSGMTARDSRFNTGSGASYIVIGDSAGDVGTGTITGLTWSNNGSATSAAAFYSLLIQPPVSAGGAVAKVKVGGVWVTKPAKVKVGGVWVTKPLRVKAGGVWVP